MGRIFTQSAQTAKRRELRRRSTRAERLLWRALRDRELEGYKFRRQHSVAYFVLDFYCPELKLAIEVDGCSHDSEEAKKYDKQRQEIIQCHGVKFLRVTDDEVHGNVEKVLEKIRSEVSKLKR